MNEWTTVIGKILNYKDGSVEICVFDIFIHVL